jgi:hypothetical protein
MLMSWPWVLQWRWRGLPFRVHVSVLIGALLAAVLFTGTDAVIAYALLMIVHILGHVGLCWRHQMTLARIDLHAFGGDAAPQGRLQPTSLVTIGVGGMGAQLLLAVLLFAASAFIAPSPFQDTLSQLNLLLLALNLIPLRGSDGRFLWTLLRAYVHQEESQQLQEQQQHWKSLLSAEQKRDSLSALSGRQVSKQQEHAAREQILTASLHEAAAAELREQDARADTGVSEDLTREVQSLLDDVWS